MRIDGSNYNIPGNSNIQGARGQLKKTDRITSGLNEICKTKMDEAKVGKESTIASLPVSTHHTAQKTPGVQNLRAIFAKTAMNALPSPKPAGGPGMVAYTSHEENMAMWKKETAPRPAVHYGILPSDDQMRSGYGKIPQGQQYGILPSDEQLRSGYGKIPQGQQKTPGYGSVPTKEQLRSGDNKLPSTNGYQKLPKGYDQIPGKSGEIPKKDTGYGVLPGS